MVFITLTRLSCKSQSQFPNCTLLLVLPIVFGQSSSGSSDEQVTLYLGLAVIGVAQGTILGPVLFNVFITDLEEAAEHTLITFSGNTKLGGCGQALEGRAATQGDSEEEADRNLVKLNEDKREVWHLARRSPVQPQHVPFRKRLLQHSWSGHREL